MPPFSLRPSGLGAGRRFKSLASCRFTGGRAASSLAFGPTQPPLLTDTIPQHFASIVSKYGDRPAVISRSPSTSPEAFSAPAPVRIPHAQETILTYEELDLRSNSLAHSLRSLGVRKGDRVAVKLGNCPEFATLTYAVFKLGAILVPLNPAFGAPQIAAALSHLKASVLIVGAVTDLAYKPCRGRDNLPLIQALVPNLEASELECPDVPTLRRIIVVDNTTSHPGVAQLPLPSHRSLTPYSLLHDLASLPNSSTRRPIVPDEPLRADETINIQFTSGTTSLPKAAMLTHTGILNNGALIASRMNLTPADKIVCPPPLFHCFGCVLGYMATATTGASIIFPSPAFDPKATLLAASEHRATAIYGVATMFVAMLELLASGKVLSQEQAAALPTHLRGGIAAGASVPEALMLRLFEKLGVPELVICYGQTETSPVSIMTRPSDPLDKRTCSVGKVMPHTGVKIVQPGDRTKIVPIGEKGEIATSGYLIMQGYWGDENRTKEDRLWAADDDDGLGAAVEPLGIGKTVPESEEQARRNGRVWMFSGDEGVMDKDGYVAVTGRIKDLIIRGGENIHPLEIENCLFQHPLVAEASVVGVSDERYGEVVGAFVVPHKGVKVVEDRHEAPPKGGAAREEERAGQVKRLTDKVLTKNDLRDWVKTRLSGHLSPRYVFWVDDYPKTASGKIQKYKLRETATRLVSEA
ncbi:hypothetical protein ACKVWC_010797 [Pyricularia oryzae]